MCGKVLLAVMKAQWGDGGGRILLGDIIGDGAVMLRPIGFLCVGVWISTELPFMYTHIEFTTYIYTQFRLEQNSSCTGPCRA
jgi:hypothetical protein